MPATHKIVNGVEVPLEPAEAAAIEAEWADNAPGTGAKWLAAKAKKAADEEARLRALARQLAPYLKEELKLS